MTNRAPNDRKWIAIFALMLAAIASALLVSPIGGYVGGKLFDTLAKTLPRQSPDDIVLVVVDEASLEKLGRWPWSRNVHARLIDRLDLAQVSAIGMNLIFTEPELSDSGADAALVSAVANSGRVVLPVTYQGNGVESSLQIGKTISGLADAAALIGHTDFELEQGIVRKLFLKAGIGEPSWPGFALAVLQVGRGFPVDQLPGVRNANLATASVDHWIGDHLVLIPFLDGPGQFARLSFADVLDPGFDARSLQGKIVLIGVEATGLADTFATPVSSQTRLMSGVELQANVLDALRHGLLVAPLDEVFAIALTLLLVAIPVVLFPRLRPRYVLYAAVLLSVSPVAISAMLLHAGSLWFDASVATLTLFLSYPIWISHKLRDSVHLLFDERQYSKTILDAIGDAVVTVTPGMHIEYLNSSAEKLSGQAASRSHGMHFDNVFAPAAADITTGTIHQALAKCASTCTTVRCATPVTLINRAGEEIIVSATLGPIVSKQNTLRSIVIGMTDVTDKIDATRQLAFHATHDPLTRLPNRNVLFERMELAITRASRLQKMIAVLFIDFDRFKHVNDELGHRAGDQLLKQVAQRLKACAREGDTVSRLGSDEFVVLLDDLNDANISAQVARQVLDLSSTAYEIEERKLLVSCSIGISLYPKDGRTANELLQRADSAMYQVKKSGRNDMRYFSPEINRFNVRRSKIQKDLYRALQHSEFEMHYQPQFSISSKKISGVESLIRWNRRDGEPLSPNQFIPIAEDNGLINVIGEWVLQVAGRKFVDWDREGLRPQKLSVNISPKQVLDRRFRQIVVSALKSTGMPPDCLELEITEHSIVTDLQRTAEVLESLKSIGCSIAIDDFGTGYSSLSYLKHLPVDTLKIDSSFVFDIAQSTENQSITQAIISMAHGLNMKVVAEGVETRQQLQILSQQNCDEFQGYLKAAPLDASAMTGFLREHALRTNSFRDRE